MLVKWSYCLVIVARYASLACGMAGTTDGLSPDDPHSAMRNIKALLFAAAHVLFGHKLAL
jgi:hypothetical protein